MIVGPHDKGQMIITIHLLKILITIIQSVFISLYFINSTFQSINMFNQPMLNFRHRIFKVRHFFYLIVVMFCAWFDTSQQLCKINRNILDTLYQLQSDSSWSTNWLWNLSFDLWTNGIVNTNTSPRFSKECEFWNFDTSFYMLQILSHFLLILWYIKGKTQERG